MAIQALYNRWRGQTFDDILGQDHITQTLRNQIRSGRIGHAYLFTGLRGTGKTSTARILAKAVNCVGDTDDPPCNQCPICQSITETRSLDLIEIDAASNRGIDEIRDLRDRVGFAPHECRYKVYVIDEVHMLTNEAFNALLKTLEEPPSHVIFVLCTTEPHRLPDTILSRCQRFDFRRGSVETLCSKLRRICDQEGIAISDQALDLVARRAAGSFRDSESLLDQLAAYGDNEITIELVQDILGSVSWTVLADLVEALVTRDVPAALRLINQSIDGGAEPRQFLTEIIEHLRALMLLQVGGAENLDNLSVEVRQSLEEILRQHDVSLRLVVRAIRLFGDAGQGLRSASRAQLPLELALIEAVMEPDVAQPAPQPAKQVVKPRTTTAAERPRARAFSVPAPESTRTVEPAKVERAPKLEERPVAPPAEPRVPQAEPAPDPQPEPQSESVKAGEPEEPVEAGETAAAEKPLAIEWVQGYWQKVVFAIKGRNRQVQALLNSAFPVAIRGGKVVIGCEAEFHRGMLADDTRRRLIEDIMTEVLGRAIQIELVVDQSFRDAEAKAPAEGDLFGPGGVPAQQSVQDQLRDHPAVKALERRGGQVSNVQVYDDENRQGG